MGGASRLLMRLRPVTFHYKAPYDDGSHRLQYGLIAEEVAKIDPELVELDGKGQAQTVRYHLINMMLLNEVQQQEGTLASQTAQLETLRSLTDRQRAELDQQKQLLAEQDARLQKLEALLAHPAAAPKAP
jgi:septal ring factor EnvC (AmiA/AmiB activator)